MTNNIEAALIFLLAICLGLVGLAAFMLVWFLCYPLHVIEAGWKRAMKHAG